MNKFSKKKFLNNLLKSKLISILPLEMKVICKNNKIKNYLAINEVSVLRQSKQAALISIKNKSKFIIKEVNL